MKKIAILILSILIAGLFVACNQDVTVDAQTYANIEVGTFVLNGQNYATLQEAVNAKLGKSAKAVGANDGVIYLTRNASGPGAVINSAVTGGVTIDFAGYTYSFTNVTGLQGGEAPKPESFGLAVTNGAQVTLKGMEKIDLNDKSTSALTMVYIEGAETKLSIESAPKMVVEPEQYVFWAANGATLTIGGETQVGGGVAATAESSVKTTETAKLEKTTLKAEKSTIIFNSTVTPTIQTLQVSDAANLVVAGAAPEVTKNDSDANASYTIINTTDDTVTIPDTTGEAISVPTNQEVAVEDGKTQTAEDIDGVAAIEYVIYETLDGADGAVAGAKSGDTILLLKDVDFNSSSLVIPKDKNVVLDLNGHKIESTGWVVTNLGTLKIVDNTKEKKGIIQSTKGCGVEGSGSASVTTIESGNVLAQEAAFMLFYGASGTINGGTFTTVDNFVVGTNGTAGQGKNTIVINGGTFNGNITSSGYVACGIYAPNDDSITVNGGTFTVTNGAGIVARAGNVTVTGGSFTCTGDTTGKVGDSKVVVPCSAIVYDSSSNYPGRTDESKITVSDGKFTSADDDGVVVFVDAGDTNERIVLTGGEYSSDPSMFVAEGYEAVAQGTELETWKVSVISPVAKIGDATFFSLEAAVSAAKDGDTIELLQSIYLAAELKIEKSLTLDLGGNNITAINHEAIWVAEGTVVISGSGKISANKDEKEPGADSFKSSVDVIYVGSSSGETNVHAGLVIGKDVIVSSNHCYGVVVCGKETEGQALDVYGTIEVTNNSAISGNGTAVYTSTTINIYDGAEITSENGYAIYQPQAGTLTIKGGTISGKGGIEAKAGEIIVEGGTITATAEEIGYKASSNGPSTSGYALATVENKDYKGPGKVTISGGKFNGFVAVAFDSEAKDFDPSISITGGVFTSNTSDYVADGYGLVFDVERETFSVKEAWTKFAEKPEDAVTYLNANWDAYSVENNIPEESRDAAKTAILDEISEYDAYIITTPEQLAWLAVKDQDISKKMFVILGNIDLSDYAWIPINNDPEGTWIVGADKNSKISNMNAVGMSGVGLFGFTRAASFADVIIDNAVVVGVNKVGGLKGGSEEGCDIYDCTVSNSYFRADTNWCYDAKEEQYVWDDGDKVGAICGYYVAGKDFVNPTIVLGNKVKNCTIIGYRDLGSVIGYVNASNNKYVMLGVEQEDPEFKSTNDVVGDEDSTTINSVRVHDYKNLGDKVERMRWDFGMMDPSPFANSYINYVEGEGEANVELLIDGLPVSTPK